MPKPKTATPDDSATVNQDEPSVSGNAEADKPTVDAGSTVQNDSAGPHLDGIAAIAESLAGSLPEVQAHAVEAHRAERAELERERSLARDKRGDHFDPELHATDDEGQPKYTQAGYFARKRGRKPGQSVSRLNIPNQRSPEQQAADSQKMQQRAAGVAAANTLITLGIVIGGDEWRPLKDSSLGLDEKLNLETAFADYFQAAGLNDIPPGMALSIAVVGYAAPRFTMPKTQTRMQKAGGWIKKWWVNRKLKKHGLKADNKDAA